MDRVRKCNELQTLKKYKKTEATPVEISFKRLECALQRIRINYPISHLKNDDSKIVDELIKPPRVKTIEFQNTLNKIENDLNYWVNGYREMIEEYTELDRILPKNHHELEQSDKQAKENVEKIIKIELIRDKVLEDFKKICIRFEDHEEKSRKQIKSLQTDLHSIHEKAEAMEYELMRLKNRPS